MKHSVEKLAEAAGAQLLGNGKVEIGGIASLESATESDLVFVEGAEALRTALESPAGAVVAGEFARGTVTRKPLLIARQPRLAFARAGKVIFPPRRREPGIASSAFVHDSVKLGKLVSVESGCYIGEGSVIGDRTRVGAGGFMAPKVTIGDDCSIKAHVSIYSHTTVGNRVVVQAGTVLGSDGFGYVRDEASGVYEKFPQVGRLEIGDDVEIG
ncbi:MAG TPA: LpxD N-terminal domain-containing protein, partial [Terriglobales bacterium]|nr:LpxD N-terminal domain-containing protein [Terriglobales bacterium]